ncbi:phage tail protein I [Aliarcobacter cryaerophilus]|uniref:phage tail protein I n=1 Tax=Aliarcobacter cryaerophilus TaxID=28198 RepID=UPI0021B65743|nr:phage tail protein I [Aliarcobacter cryaerophilus]MCT7405614.1 phage tail protein I [Aliarcobacter cryaerophilus]MCT7503443.1 phage tail protein I [Aliarcobacter cryaerophilus]
MVLIPVNESEDLKVTDKSVDNRFEFLKNFDLNLFPKSCKKEYLSHLAFLFDVDIRALSETETREILSRAITLKKYIGSVYYLEQMLNIFDKEVSVKEWFSYAGQPYYFKVEVQSSNKSIDAKFYEDLEKQILKYKNVRSVLDVIVINLKTNLKEKYAMATITGEEIEVLPYTVRNLNFYQKEIYATAIKMSECITLNLVIGDL